MWLSIYAFAWGSQHLTCWTEQLPGSLPLNEQQQKYASVCQTLPNPCVGSCQILFEAGWERWLRKPLPQQLSPEQIARWAAPSVSDTIILPPQNILTAWSPLTVGREGYVSNHHAKSKLFLCLKCVCRCFLSVVACYRRSGANRCLRRSC